MWIIIPIIFLVILFVINQNLKESHRKHLRFTEQGGLWKHYSFLISSILADNPSLLNKDSSAERITLVAYYERGYEKYYITTSMSSSKVYIFWEMDSIELGKHNLKWTFNSNDRQQTMAATISSGVLNYKQKLLM